MTLAPPSSFAGPASVMARISQIAAKFEAPATSTSGAASTDSSFDSVLSGLLGTSTSDSASATGGVTGQQIVDGSMQYLGVPYKWGGTDPDTGLDCSGFVQQAYEDFGIDLPRVSRDQAKVGTEVPSIDQAKPGDLVAFGSPVDHIGIYVGDNRMIVAPHTGDVVKIQEITRPVATIRRVIGTDAASTGTAALGASSRLALASRLGTSTGTTSIGTGTLPANVPYRDLFESAGAKHGVDPRLLAAVAKVESGFNPNAVSSAGATGLMQFMPATARGMNIDPSDPAQAIDGAARYLKGQMNRFGSVELALAAYNAGPAAVVRAGGIPNNSQTQAYVPKVLGIMNGARW